MKQLPKFILLRGKIIKQKHGKKMIVQNQPMPPLTTKELDWVYSLPYMRAHFNGDITYSTEEGKGTIFNIILPQ